MPNLSKRFALIAACGLFSLPVAAAAALPAGAVAPQIVTKGAIAGKSVTFDLKKALKRGPVVLYFYPKAFTKGCTLEAHAFAEATDDFARYGATVIGLSNDDLPTLRKFSREECRDKFAVGIASPQTIGKYDAHLVRDGKASGLADRISYVVAPDGRIAFVHSDMDYRDHVRLALAAVRKLSGR